MDKINQLISYISNKNTIHAKYLKNIVLTQNERKEFENLLHYYTNRLMFNIEEQAEYYLMFLEKNLEETKFFLENGKYRYNTFNEVKNKVYFNDNYMKKYMIGLSISSFLWTTHKKVRNIFMDLLDKTISQQIYLEVGPGHGEFFLSAVESKKFEQYIGVDISPTSCDMTKDIVLYNNYNINDKCEFICADFLEIDLNKNVNLIVMGEVLEHVEQPLLFLKKAKSLLNKTIGNGVLFATIPINAPDIDHIFLFSHPNEVENMVIEAGFTVKYKEFCIANGYSLEKALKYKTPILMVVILNG